jgi:hypothetical protein
LAFLFRDRARKYFLGRSDSWLRSKVMNLETIKPGTIEICLVLDSWLPD